jgi:hypothetical protein
MFGLVALVGLASLVVEAQSPGRADVPTGSVAASHRAVIDRYCVTCHNQRLKTGGLELDTVGIEAVSERADIWEKVVGKLRSGAMPPRGSPRPAPGAVDALASWLEASLDAAGAAAPNPGRTATFHRLNRAEYRNVIRDLLALEIDVDELLPPDPASYGFDNIGDVLGVSPGLLDRYLSAARKISRLAIGSSTILPDTVTHVVPTDLNQDDWLEGLPFGSRGGAILPRVFPADGEYVVALQLARETVAGEVVGLGEPHQVDVLLDGSRVKRFTVGEPSGEPGLKSDGLYGNERLRTADRHLEVRLPITAGPHNVGATFLRRSAAEVEAVRQPFLGPSPETGDSHGLPYLNKITITGPFAATAAGHTPARQRVFVCEPASQSGDEACATRILSALGRRAFRRPLTGGELQGLLGFYRDGLRTEGRFDAGIELALRRILVSLPFLVRIEDDPEGAAPGSMYRIDDYALASRLSFFLWSSLPDDQLLDRAADGTLHEPPVLRQQVHRMLADRRSQGLVTTFVGQWLQTRNVSSVRPDRRLFPDFNENLRVAFRKETELFFESIVREDRGVLDLLTADYTFVNEWLARHYGIPNVYGDRFRRIRVDDGVRGGLLGHGSILTVRSYANRTSPVLRGVWILENILGAPPPPPPPNVPDLKPTNTAGRLLSMREQMDEHRRNATCAACHARMDPLGLSLENFDAVGRWRDLSEGHTPIDAAGALPNGMEFVGVAGLRRALALHSDEFVRTFVAKLMTYALGRGLEFYDGPAIRRVVRDAAADMHRFSDIVVGIVTSPPFLMRRTADPGSGG